MSSPHFSTNMLETIEVGEQDSGLRIVSRVESFRANLVENVMQVRQRKSDWSSIAPYFRYPGV